MNKNFLIIGIIIVSIFIISAIIFTNKNNSGNNLTAQLENNSIIENNNEVNNNLTLNSNTDSKDLESLQNIPIPDSIVFYHNGVQKEFISGTNEFNEIITLNNKRDSGNLSTGILELVVDINDFLKNNDMLEYKYQNYNPIYFTLIDDEQLEKDNTKTNWVSVGYDSRVFKQFIYGGLTSADNLINYLNTLK